MRRLPKIVYSSTNVEVYRKPTYVYFFTTKLCRAVCLPAKIVDGRTTRRLPKADHSSNNVEMYNQPTYTYIFYHKILSVD